jgi:predicted nucleic-acid-binding protein
VTNPNCITIHHPVYTQPIPDRRFTMMDQIRTVINALLKDDAITIDDQQQLRHALQSNGILDQEMLLWVTCRNRRKMSGRDFVAIFCQRFGRLLI